MPRSFQLKFPPSELERLKSRIENDFDSASADHQRRMDRWARYYRRFRNLVDTPRAGDERKPNHTVPLIQWSVLAKLAKEVDAILGDGADVLAVPVGPSDQRAALKTSRYMRWRVFDSMKIANPLVVFLFRKILFGRSFAYAPWLRTEAEMIVNGARGWYPTYEGPGFIPLWPDDLIVPAEESRAGVRPSGEDCGSIQEFSFCIRRYLTTPNEMRRRAGDLYSPRIKDKDLWQRILHQAESGAQRDDENDQVKIARDEATGVLTGDNESSRNAIRIWEWYGRWRPLKKGVEEADENDGELREPFEREYVVRYACDLHEIVSIQDLVELYPRMADRRPFVESALIRDGSYWPAGLGELLEMMEDEATATSRLFTEAGELSVWPFIFAKPGDGMDPGKPLQLEPGQVNWSADPGGVNVIQINPKLDYLIAKNQDTLANAERVSGQSDQTLGRAVDRPNAPRTATGQVLLSQEGNVRISLDTVVLREDLNNELLSRIYRLDQQFAPPKQFFRVTEEDSRGMFETKRGGSEITLDELQEPYDFRIKFASSAYNREVERQNFMALFQLLMTMPIIAMDPRAQWQMADVLCKKFGFDTFSDVVAKPADMGMPKEPAEEWNAALQGEDIPVHPQDHDERHLADHARRVQEELDSPNPDEDAVKRMLAHMKEQRDQMQTKKLMVGMVNQVADSLKSNNSQTGGLTLQPGGGGMPMPLQNLAATAESIVAPPQEGMVNGQANGAAGAPGLPGR